MTTGTQSVVCAKCLKGDRLYQAALKPSDDAPPQATTWICLRCKGPVEVVVESIN